MSDYHPRRGDGVRPSSRVNFIFCKLEMLEAEKEENNKEEEVKE